jgi:ribosomal protein S18 acetylase RimI-like enzyme
VTIAIRRLVPDDLAGYKEIRLEALKTSPTAFGASYEGVSGRPDSYFLEAVNKLALFGAFDGARQVGLVAFRRNEGMKDAHRGDLIQMYVRPEARGTGAAMSLVQTVIAHAATMVEQLHLSVTTDNAPAIRLYEKAGFTIYGTEPRALKVDGRYIDEHLMVRFLEGTRKEE